MSRDRLIAVRYLGEAQRNVPGVGTFQHGTTVFLPPAQACELARDDDFTLVGGGPPIVRMNFQISQINPEIEIRPPTPAGGTEEWLREEEEERNDEQPG